MAEREKLSDRKLKALKPVYPVGHKKAGKPLATGDRYDVMDSEVSGFGVRVTDKGKLTFVLLTRYPGSNNPTRRAVGEYPTDSLSEARERARQWRKWIEKGKDPKNEEEALRLAEIRKKADTFDTAVEAYIKRVLPKQRRGDIVAKELRDTFSARWKGRSPCQGDQGLQTDHLSQDQGGQIPGACLSR